MMPMQGGNPWTNNSMLNLHAQLQGPPPLSLANSRVDIHLPNNTASVQMFDHEDRDDNDCNVLDDEEEALDAIKARQADQAQRVRDHQSRVYQKIAHVEQHLLGVASLLETVSSEVGSLAFSSVESALNLGRDIDLAREEAATSQRRQEQVRKAWEAEVRALNQVS